MSVPCYLVRHGKEYLLFDAGLGDGHLGRRDAVLDMTLEVRRKPAPHFASLGLQPPDIGTVAISHFHFDHVGNLALFGNGVLLVQRAEAERVRKSPYPFTPAEAVERLDSGRVELLDGDRDVFSDGSVLLLSTPGHSPGHQSLLVRLRRTGTVLLTGDLYHYAARGPARHPSVPRPGRDAGGPGAWPGVDLP